MVGTFLYYARAVNPTMLVTFNNIEAKQSNRPQAKKEAVNQLLNYDATHSDTIIRCYSSGMVLHIQSNASFLSDAESNSIVGGYHYISTKSADPHMASLKQPPLN